jgi:hypothetical protein
MNKQEACEILNAAQRKLDLQQEIAGTGREMYNMLCEIDADYLDEGCDGCGTISSETAAKLRALLEKLQKPAWT